ncbi:hypothetical protein C1645_776165 [Glomus cerebriforme]|uniref:Uncharacterized protein n=1 Tax=Glomus cerebriforme TaxID=658196 RepID=A0A397SYF3_9GLOM|nr:hypothetical protein C1645_776165 [Glomus cerebriforme]
MEPINDRNNGNNPLPISFITFIDNENNCYSCGTKYSQTLLFEQKYCKSCLCRYIQKDNDTYLDVYNNGHIY